MKTPALHPPIKAVGWRKPQLVHPGSHHPMAFHGFVSCHVLPRHTSSLAVDSNCPELMLLSKEVKSLIEKEKPMKLLKIRNALYLYNFTPNPSHAYFMLDLHTCLHLWDLIQFLVLDFPPTVLGSQRNIFKITYWLLPQGENMQAHKYPIFWSEVCVQVGE